MNLMDRTLLGALLRPFLFCLAAFYFLFVLVDLFDSLGDLIRAKADLGLLLRYYLAPAPFIFQLIVPPAFYLAVIYVLVNWSSNRQLVALHAAGVSLHRISIPFFALSLAVAAVQHTLYHDLTPRAQERRDALENQLERRAASGSVFPRVVYKNPTSGVLWYAQSIDIAAGTLTQAEILVPDDLGRDRMKIFAAQGTYRDGYWDFAGVRRVEFARDGTAAAPQDLAQWDAHFLNESPAQIVAVLRPATGMAWKELSGFINAPYQPAPNRMAPYRTEHQYRLAYPLLTPVLCFFAFALAISHERRNKTAAVFNCLVVLALLLVWMQLSKALGNGKRIPPFLAGWSPVLIFGTTGLLLFAEKTGWLWNLRHYIRTPATPPPPASAA